MPPSDVQERVDISDLNMKVSAEQKLNIITKRCVRREWSHFVEGTPPH
jgi:hypothetical protein